MTANPGKPTPRQLAYLRALANQKGQTFTYPRTRGQASAEIDRLKKATSSTAAERRLDQRAVSTGLTERPEDATRHTPDEVSGYGASATWNHGASS